MRHTYGQLIQVSKDSVIDDTTTSYTNLSSTQAFLKQQINNTVTFLFSLLRKYKLIPPAYTDATVDGTVTYKFRPGLSKLESMTITISSLVRPLIKVESQDEWDKLVSVPQTGLPTHVFPQRDTFSLFPTPGDIYTLTIKGVFMPVNMTVDDYTTGTITITTGDETITGAGGATFTAAMVGRWLAVTDSSGIPSSNFYRIASYTDATHVELDRKVIETTASGQTYVIGESPEIPEELHEFIQYRVASIYYALRRKDMKQANALLNFFYTGDFENKERKGGSIKGGVLLVLKDLMQKGRSNSQLVETGGASSPSNIIRDGIWGLELEAAS